MLTTLAVVTATVVGVMVGVEFAVAVFVGPILRRLPVGSWIEASADGSRVLGRVMPFWYIGSLLLTAWLAAAKWDGPAGGAAVAAAALLVVSVVMSVTLLVPIANRAATWTADRHPADWREQQQRWDRLHYARVAIIVAGFVLTLVAGTVALAKQRCVRPTSLAQCPHPPVNRPGRAVRSGLSRRCRGCREGWRSR